MSTTTETIHHPAVTATKGWQYWGNVGKESAGFAVAEGGSMLTSLGVVALTQFIPKNMMHAVCSPISKICVEPYLETIEKGLSKICKLEECQADNSKPREERAEAITKTLLVFGAAWVASIKAKLWIRQKINKGFGIHDDEPLPMPEGVWNKIKYKATLQGWSPQEKLIIAADEGVHYGSLLLMNTGAARYTDDMIRTTTSILEKMTGASHERCHELATMCWVWEMPNFLGMAAGVGAIAAKHKGFKLGAAAAHTVEQLTAASPQPSRT